MTGPEYLTDGRDHCGCCGSPCDGQWCPRCRQHIGKAGLPWERTYLALYGEHCPYQVKAQ